MKNSQKGFAIPVIIAIVALLAIGGGAYFYTNNRVEVPINIPDVVSNVPTSTIKTITSITIPVKTQPGACTADAKQCPDGSYVGRSGPSCEFVCPEVKGIIITSIKSNDLVKLPITIEGYLDGNGWGANEGEVGLVEVFDANNKSISSKEIIKTTTDWLVFPTYFSTMVGDRQMMSYIKTDSGYVKLTANVAKNGDEIKILIIPVRFK